MFLGKFGKKEQLFQKASLVLAKSDGRGAAGLTKEHKTRNLLKSMQSVGYYNSMKLFGP